jgi:hypothetical protein
MPTDIPVDGQHTLDEFAKQISGMEKEEFVAKNANPFLVLELRRGKLRDDGVFKTVPPSDVWEADQDKPLLGTSLLPHEVAVIPLVKSDRNEIEHITLGRSANNDVMVLYQSVSKLHAVFRVEEETGAVILSDAGSTFGTVVAGVTLKPQKGVTLNSGASIVFGKAVRAAFFTPADLFEYLRLQKRFKRLN